MKELKYDFQSVIERRGKDAHAVEDLEGFYGPGGVTLKEGFDFIPMWVADMNFATCPAVTKAIIKRAEHPLFGYFAPSEDYISAILRWQKEQHHVENLTKEDIGYENGVLGGMLSALTSLASPGDPLLIHSPTYAGFTKSITANGYRIVLSPLKKDENGVFRMDYEDMDKQIKENNIHVALLCSPHNPLGRVWEREELRKAMEVYKNNDVTVISDEIWSDIILEGHEHIPTQSISEDARNRTVALYAPSKTFNLAGLVGSYHIIYNKRLRDTVVAKSEKSHYNNMNVLSMHALVGAYSDEGKEWAKEMISVITENAKFACDYIEQHFEGVTFSKPEGTYMLFIDCEEYLKKHNIRFEKILRAGWEVGIGWQDGRMFHGPTHIRLNLALPKCKLEEAFNRMEKYVFVK